VLEDSLVTVLGRPAREYHDDGALDFLGLVNGEIKAVFTWKDIVEIIG
jgi:hypothetical protein